MNDPHDIERLIAQSKGEVPLLGQQVPVMHGLPVNGKLLTIYDLEKMSDLEFRELFLAAIISLAGGMYMPPPPPTEEVTGDAEDAPELDSE